jgi:uncharacterized protein YyaL (SSP411 family)
MKKLYIVTELFKYYSSFLNYDLLKHYLRNRTYSKKSEIDHLVLAIQWICCAQDAINDGGVARSYSFIYNPYFKRKGWIPSYPETTGYIIPTMFDYANLVGNQEIYDRAIRMADWECDVQMENGAVQGGTIDQSPIPAIFNTGQVIFGWLRAFQETKKEKYLNCAIKAGKFLVEQQSKDGSWRNYSSIYTNISAVPVQTYNTRTAWALLLLFSICMDPVFKETAIRNVDFSLKQQSDNGWFEFNCLFDPSQPLLHTIAYSVEGILEIGIFLRNQYYINSAKKTVDAIIEKLRDNGKLPGRFNNRWEPTVTWSCLTGDAQIAVICGRLFQLTKDRRYLDCMSKINRYLERVQLLRTNNQNIYGGISGSDPLHGHYGRFEILNWAVKFFADALMLVNSIYKDDKTSENN